MLATTSAKKTEARMADLEAEITRLQAELGADVDAEKIVKKHIKLLHRYNEAKDATQILIGRLANLKDTTIKQIHEDYDLTDAD
ncbi:DNA repair protein [Schizophyllum commune]